MPNYEAEQEKSDYYRDLPIVPNDQAQQAANIIEWCNRFAGPHSLCKVGLAKIIQSAIEGKL